MDNQTEQNNPAITEPLVVPASATVESSNPVPSAGNESATQSTFQPPTVPTNGRVVFETKMEIDDLGDSLSDLNSNGSNLSGDQQDLNALDPDHPLLASIQESLYQQLLKQEEDLNEMLRLKRESLSKETEHRQKIGLDLYQAQQKLAQLQDNLDQSQKQYNETLQSRQTAETKLQSIRKKHQELSIRFDAEEKKIQNQRAELSRLNELSKRLEIHQDELKAELAVTKRITMKAEEDMEKQEMTKRRQDFYIDQLNEKIFRLQEQSALYDYRIKQQREEIRSFRDILSDAQNEIESILMEKKQLISHWKASVVALEKRDQMMNSIESAIEKEDENLLSLNREYSALKTIIRESQEKQEQLEANLNRLQSEKEQLERQIQITEESKERMKDSFNMYSKTMEQTQSQLDDGQKQQKALENQIGKSNKDIHRIVTKTQQTEMDITSEIQAQAGIEKQKGGTVRDATKLKNQIFEKEEELSNMENEIANMKVDVLHSEDRLSNYKQQLGEIEDLISDENKLISTYEGSLKKTLDEMTKKQSEMDMLNRRYDHLVAQNAAADGAIQGEIGPLEATISSLNKNIKLSEKEIVDLQQKWLRAQTDLVALTKEMEDLRNAIEESKTRRTVLERKKIVLNGAFDRTNNDIKLLERDIRKVRSDMEKINFLLAKQNKTEKELKENNLGLEIVFKNRLKEAEHESIRVEKMIEKIKEEKEQALNDLIDVERQVMFWEHKIQVAKDNKKMMDPNYGGTEIMQMEQELSRLNVYYTQLLKRQEQLIAEMERAVQRHGDLSSRTIQADFDAGKGASYQMRNALRDLQRKIKDLESSIAEYDAISLKLTIERQQLGDRIKNLEISIEELKLKQESINDDLINNQRARAKKMHQIGDILNRSKRYKDLSGGKYVYLCKDDTKRPEQYIAQKERMEQLENLVGELELAEGASVLPAIMDQGFMIINIIEQQQQQSQQEQQPQQS